MITYGETRFLMMGDAETAAEMDLLDYQALQKRFQSMLTVVTESSPAMAGNGATGEMVSLSAQ